MYVPKMQQYFYSHTYMIFFNSYYYPINYTNFSYSNPLYASTETTINGGNLSVRV